MGTGGGTIVVKAVEDYLHRVAPDSDGVIREMEEYGRERGFPYIGPLVGRTLRLLAKSVGATRVFECGSGFGYSAAWLSEAVGSGGEIFLTDGDPKNLEMAKEYLTRLGVVGRCRFLTGEAIGHLTETPGFFDLILVDIDKEGYPGSLDVTVPKLLPGGLLITDNVLWSGEVTQENPDRASTRAIQEYNRRLYAHPDLETVIVPLRDGISVSRKN